MQESKNRSGQIISVRGMSYRRPKSPFWEGFLSVWVGTQIKPLTVERRRAYTVEDAFFEDTMMLKLDVDKAMARAGVLVGKSIQE